MFSYRSLDSGQCLTLTQIYWKLSTQTHWRLGKGAGTYATKNIVSSPFFSCISVQLILVRHRVKIRLYFCRAEAKELRERYMQKYHGGVGGVSQAVQPVTDQVQESL